VGWAVVSVWAGRQAKVGKWLGRLRRGGGHEEAGWKGGPGRLGRMGQKGGSIFVRFQLGFVPMRFRKISK
jgi:hypothetical protein